MKGLSELEGVVLGLVGLRHAATAYAIRSEIANSRSSHWRGSAGSVYPAIQRLARRGLIARSRVPEDNRRGVTLRLSPAGRRSLRRWIGPPLPDWVGAPTFDPIRTRVTFLAQLDVRARRRLVHAATTRVQLELAAAIRYARSGIQDNPPWERLIALGTIAELRGRLRWMHTVQATFLTRARTRASGSGTAGR